MPKLKDVVCQLEWPDTGSPFKEYGVCYGDGVVESFVVVPNKPQPFVIRVTSRGFISEGLAVVVYIDGHYQCNRNRVNLLPSNKGLPRDRTEVDFLFRQKEKSMGDGTFMGRGWRFDDHNIVTTLPDGVTNDHFNMLGNIEVLVLRCAADNPDDTNASTTSSAAASIIMAESSDDEKSSPSPGGKEEANNTEKAKKSKSKEATPVSEAEENLLDDFFGIFDGPSDYGRHPYPPLNHMSGGQAHATNPREDFPQGYRPGPGYPREGPTSRGGGHFSTQDHGLAPHSRDYQPHSEKRVHFDYGQIHMPPPDPTRYWDGPGAPESQPPPHHQYYTPGLSEWYGSLAGHYGGGPRHQQPPYYDHQNGGYGVQAGYPEIPPPNSHYGQPPPRQHHLPPSYGQPSYHSQHSSGMPRWPAGHPMSQWPPYSGHGMNLQNYSSYYTPHYGVSIGRDNASAGFGGGEDGNATEKEPGSLDPAKDENNSNDKACDAKTDSNPTEANPIGDGDDYKNEQNTDSGDNSGWDNNTGNTQNNATNQWDSEDNQNNDSRNANNDSGDNNSNGQTGRAGGDTSKQNNNISQGGWGETTQTSSEPGGRSLYGPHGAYYAMKSSAEPVAPCDAEEEPRYDVPKAFADEWGSTKQVQPGSGYLYYKKSCRPRYIDPLSEPYAKFVFKYRTREELKAEVNIEVDTEPSANAEVQSFQDMPKDELIQMLLRAKGALGGKIPSPPPRAPDAAEEEGFRGVAVPHPPTDFLEYDLPDRRVRNSNGAANGDKNNGFDNINNATTKDWGPPADNNTSSDDKAWVAGGDGGGNTTTPATTEFPQESWDAAQKQQQNGPPPAPPPRGGW